MAKKSTNYLNNKDLLIEIHKSKMTFVELEEEDYYYFDAIVYDINVLTDDDICSEHYGTWSVEYILEGTRHKEEISNLFMFLKKDRDKKEILSKTLLLPKSSNDYINDVKASKLKKMKKEDSTIDMTISDILTGDLIFRFMTYKHIPHDVNWDEKKPLKKDSDSYIKVNFPPFQHFLLENGQPRCVGLSHYHNGEFCLDNGKINEKLGYMFMLMVDKIGKKGSFRNYTYLDEMKSSAHLQLSQVGLMFDEGRSQQPNPFAFYTTVVTNVFKRVLNTEKKNRDIRDDLIEMAGRNPSHTRQLLSELSQQSNDDNWSPSVDTAIKRKRTETPKK